jgi:hypothetical protein
MTASSQQDAGGRGGLGCVVSFLDCFQTRRREAAGEARYGGDLRSRTSALNRCRIESRRGSGRCIGLR